MLGSMNILRNPPLFQRSIDHGQYVIELHAWQSPESASFATFIYEKGRRMAPAAFHRRQMKTSSSGKR
jgi:hypothetical protein